MANWVPRTIIVLGFVIKLTSTISLHSEDKCGGVVMGSGSISYKPSSSYEPNELCLWTVINTGRDLLSFDLVSEGFAEAGDHVEIFYLPSVNTSVVPKVRSPLPSASPHCDGPILFKRFKTCMLRSSVAFILFRSNHALQGTGFVLNVVQRGMPLLGRQEIGANPPSLGPGWVDLERPFPRPEIVAWSITDPMRFVLFRFNFTKERCTLTSEDTTFSVFQLGRESPTLIHKVCGQMPPGTPFQYSGGSTLDPIVLLLSTSRYIKNGEVKFYYNMESPPPDWTSPGSRVTGTTLLITVLAAIAVGSLSFREYK